MQIGTSTQGKSNQSTKYTGDGPIIGDSNTGDQEENRKRNQSTLRSVGDKTAPARGTGGTDRWDIQLERLIRHKLAARLACLQASDK